MQYVKFISETEIQYPTAAEFPGVVNWRQHDAKLRAKQYFPLTGKPEPNEGKILKLDTFALHTATKQRKEAYQVVVEDYEEDTETHEKRKTGEHMEWRERTVEVDDSYIFVETYHFEDAEKEPTPLPTVFAKSEVLAALKAKDLYQSAFALYVRDSEIQLFWATYLEVDVEHEATKAVIKRIGLKDEVVDELRAWVAEERKKEK